MTAISPLERSITVGLRWDRLILRLADHSPLSKPLCDPLPRLITSTRKWDAEELRHPSEIVVLISVSSELFLMSYIRARGLPKRRPSKLLTLKSQRFGKRRTSHATTTSCRYGRTASVALRNRSSSRGEHHLPNRIEGAAEMSGNTELSFHDFVHQLNADEHKSRVVEAFESEHPLGSAFHATVILLHDVV
jgi:hypothetical protein